MFRVQVIVLLFFIQNQGSLANPTPASEDAEETNNVPQIINNEDNNKGFKNHLWNCQADSDYIQKEIALTTKLLTDGEKSMEPQVLSADETILVLGKAGSGKTSLIQFLTQNPKLKSKLVRGDTGEYIIEDGDKIGTSATESFTLYPEIINYNSSVEFCDSPGFHDSRSSAHEIVSMDIMKSTTNKFKKLKIILLENYSSLQYGLYKDNFLDTLRHLNNFLVDIDKFKDNIVLIATKVPFSYRMMDDSNAPPEFITEEMHVESVLNYLNHTEASLSQKIDQTNSKTDKDFYKKVISLLQSLQTRAEDGKVSRINIFRRPYTTGKLENNSLLGRNKVSLMKTIMSLPYSDVTENDFDFTLSDKAKMYLQCLLKLTSNNYKDKIHELAFKLREYTTQKTQDYKCFHQILTDLELLYSKMKQLSEKIDQAKQYDEVFKIIDDFILDQKILMNFSFDSEKDGLEKYERLLLKFVDASTVFIPSSWTLPIRQATKFTEEELQWYKTLNKFIDVLSSYEYQKIKAKLASIVFNGGSISRNGLMELFMNATGITDIDNFIDIPSNIKKQSEVEKITKTLLLPSNITCDANGKLRVKGFHLMLSEINSETLIQSYCKDVEVKGIALEAVGTVFIDEDTVEAFRGVDMFIGANRWKVIGQRRIVLSGRPGQEISDDEPFVANGKDGKPGLPGGNGGTFMGIGLHFLNGENLILESNGGAGGPGKKGAKGARGLDGGTVRDNFIPVSGEYEKSSFHMFGINTDYFGSSLIRTGKEQVTLAVFNSSSSLLDVRADMKVVVEEGYCGEEGGLGGLGGEGGIGGFRAHQLVVELGHASKIRFQSEDGEKGTPGRMGETGDRGEDEMGVICVQVWFLRDLGGRPYWRCQSTGSTSQACKKCPRIDIQEKYTNTSIQRPTPLKSIDWIFESSHKYAHFLDLHFDHPIFNKIVIDFLAGNQKLIDYLAGKPKLHIKKQAVGEHRVVHHFQKLYVKVMEKLSSSPYWWDVKSTQGVKQWS